MTRSENPPEATSKRTPPAAAAAAVRDWPAYFDAIGDAGPRDTLVDATDRFAQERAVDDVDPPLAIDFGCGTGRDTIELLARGWRVLAVDGEAEALTRMLARPEVAVPLDSPRLTAKRMTFEDAELPSCMLFNASYTLPFCPPELFPSLWSRIVGAIVPGGRFAGQLFGEQDGWATLPDRTHHTRAQLEALFRGFEIEQFKQDLYGPDPVSAYPKRWHIFHVIARKQAPGESTSGQ